MPTRIVPESGPPHPDRTERDALQAALHQAQLRLIESQIAPHFLFNALGLIGYTALQEQAFQTEEIVYALSDLLRYSLHSGDPAPVLLGQELEIIDRYLIIQQRRFGARLMVQVEVEPSLRRLPIPRMILQPLVENAVIHGVEPLQRAVRLQIQARRRAGWAVLEIRDDGAGMDRARREAVLSGTVPRAGQRPAIGLRTVLRRLELEYGEQFEFELESEPGQGTRITLALPTDRGQARRARETGGSQCSEAPEEGREAPRG